MRDPRRAGFSYGDTEASMYGIRTRLACVLAVVLAAGCGATETKGKKAGSKIASTPATLATNQVVIG